MKCKYITFLLSIVLATTVFAQKPKSVEFTAEGLPDELLEYMNKSTSDGSRQKENTKVIKTFQSVYPNLDARLQERLVAFYTYAVKAKMKGNPEMCSLTRLLTTIATTPAGGKNVADAYDNVPNLDGFVASLEAFAGRNAKPKAVMDYVEFCETLQGERLLYRSNSCEWRFDSKAKYRLGVEKGVPLVWFDEPSDLHYSSAKDEGVIRGTTGVYNYKENEWEGHGGRIDWSRTGLRAEECYADLRTYKAVTKFPKFTADSVDFVHTGYFATPIRGRVEEQLANVQEAEKYSYPRFRSYQRDFVINDILPEVDYSGSFMMNGSKFITASSKHAASLVFRRGQSRRLVVTSLKFVITPSRVVAENAAVTLYVGEEDSISNTGVTVRYSPEEKQVVMVNDPKRNFYSPYIDSYHSLDIYSETITWRMDKDDLLFSNLSSAGTLSMASFESSSYYTYSKYRDIKGIDEVSPVDRVYEYTRSTGSNFSVKSFSNRIGLDMSQTLLMIHNLSKHGLLSYNEITGRVQIKDKLVDYQKAFRKDKDFDYDALSLQSTTNGTNARLTLADNSLIIRGVNEFVVSDSQAVVVYPDSLTGRQVTVGRNRSLHFSGRIHVGKFILSVTDCDFSYEDFSFNMPRIDHMEFYVPDFSAPDKYEQLVRTPLSNLVGTLQVDKSDNHSGLTKNKEYPIFNSLEDSRVFYDRPEIQGRQYKRDRFYYVLRPFTINSMVDFVTDSLQFNGVLTSAGIFPDIEEPLRVQKDYYLGFRLNTPAGGYPAYGGKGTYNKKIRLDHNGLRGSGDLDYLASHSSSKDFLFLPDSAVAVTDSFAVREEQGFPEMHNGKADLHWLPYADSMSVATLDKGRPFSMYRGDATLRGRVSLMPKGASASGTATVLEGTFTSDYFALASREMNAEVSTFTLRSTRYKDVAFSATGVKSSVNYDTRRADIQSRSGVQLTHLPLIQYDAYADRFAWEMDRKVLDIVNSTRETSEGMDGMDIRMRIMKLGDMPGVRFVSTDPKQKGLEFNSLRGTYRYNDAHLQGQSAYLISVADAAIAPAGDSLNVAKGGVMGELKGASLVCNRTDGYHYIYNADLTVASAESYTGRGYINYLDDLKNRHRLYLNDISVSNGTTIAKGVISDSANFNLSSAFGFAGRVRAEGNKEWLFFEGGVRLIQPCIPSAQLGLLAYADYTDPEHIHVTVPELPTDWKGHRITASVLIDKNTLRPQPAFLTADKVADNELLSAHGVLTYLGDRKQYMIASESKVSDPDGIVEPYLSMSTTDCVVEGEGPMDFSLKRTQASFYAYGTAQVGIRSNADDNFTAVFGFTFPIAKELVTSLANNLKEDLRLSPIGMTTNPELRHAMMHHLGADQGAATYALYSTTGNLSTIPEPMKSMFLFDNIKWQYSPTMGLYYDGKAGLISVGDNLMSVEVTLKAQIYKRNNSQHMVFYVQADRDHWYYFKYDLGSQELTIYSSMGTWADQIKALPLEQRKIEKEGLGVFRYFVGNNSSEVPNWLAWFEKTAYPND